MFWISQESWGGVSTRPDSTSPSGVITLSSTELGADVCPASPLFASTSTTAKSPDAEVLHLLMRWWESQSFGSFVMRCLLRLFGFPVPLLVPPGQSATPTTEKPPVEAQTLLSNVNFLRNMTRSSTVNQNFIAVFEGQIITIVAIVSFILVILVRDYVVQQQPDVNGRAGFDGPEAVANPVVAEPARVPEADDSSEDESENGRFPTGEQVAFHERLQADRRNRPHRHRVPRDDLFPAEDAAYQEFIAARARQLGGDAPEDEPTDERPSTAAFGGQPLQSARSSEKGSSDVEFTPESSDPSVADDLEPRSLNKEDKGKAPMMNDVTDNAGTGPSFTGPSTEPPDASFPRRRAVSDGPQVQVTVNPLANNTWSFAAISQDQPSVTPSSPTLDASTTPPMSAVYTPGDPTAKPESSQHEELESNTLDLDEYQPRPNTELVEPQLHEQDTPVIVEKDDSVPAQLPVHNGPVREPPFDPVGWVMDRLMAYIWDGIEAQDPAGEELADSDEMDEDGQWVDVPMDEGPVQIPGLDNDEQALIDNIRLNAGDQGAAAGIAGVADADGVAEGMDAEAVEDMEDFEGIMELLGMRGPITNLFQNVIFCALLVQIALFACIFTPFNMGRISIWILAKPARIVRIVFEVSKIFQDSLLFIAGLASWTAFNLIDMFTGWIGGRVAQHVVAARKGSWTFFLAAGSRVVHSFALDTPLQHSGMQYWSAVSHEALISIRDSIWSSLLIVSDTASHFKNPLPASLGILRFLFRQASNTTAILANPGGWVVDIGPGDKIPVNLELAYWSASDITWAILAGYLTLLILSTIYVNSGIRLTRGTLLEDWEQGLVDTLHQASGILKVITVISIEMLVFPLYCGLLLDFALLPLFADATLKSRLVFTYNNPWTSVFVHWFVGTGYMFHFALFVSMCRKIMRPGVLYFIRDPDDPEFHPVRDVLERNLVTQLRKIMFSAFVYGTLVVVCLGGVVWGLALAAPTVLPIHYSYNEPILEFPVDLLFYNFLIPLAFQVFKPGDGLQAMYRWCFRKSARILRLTYFLFGERRIDEEGKLQLPSDSPHQSAPLWRRLCLGLDHAKTKVVPKDLGDIINGVGRRRAKSLPHEIRYMRHKKAALVRTGQLIPDGRFVRAPASDRVKIPKGRKVFLEVNERGRRLDGQPDEGLHASEQFQMVYLPPHLLTRVFLFILCIWTFAAVTGVTLTIIPLIIGRGLFKVIIPHGVRTNDIYAFCVGLHIFGAIAYGVLRYRTLERKVKSWLHTSSNGKRRLGQQTLRASAHIAKLFYAYTVVFAVCPVVLATMVELYISLPAHTMMNPPTTATLTQSAETGDSTSQHNIRVVELWTLGLLYMRIGTKLIGTFLNRTRFATATQAIFRRGWMNPDVRVLTRAFVVPGFVLSGFAICAPPLSVFALEWLGGVTTQDFQGEAAVQRVKTYRQSYPILLFFGLLSRYFVMARSSYKALKVKVRDDVYLMGERLQNYDGSPPLTKSGKRAAPRRVAR